jgi:hypothetical protein
MVDAAGPQPPMVGLLDGVKVVEAAVLLTGDYLGMLLADEGADVVKVETPGVGDWIRDHMGEVVPRYSPYHLFVNRNKRSVTLNLKSPEGHAALGRLVSDADAFVTGFTGDVPKRLGIGYDDIRAIKPDIIVEGPVTDVPASPKNNVVEWITVIMPTGFTKDTWVTSVQIKPEFPAVTHHICVSYIPHNPNYKYGVAYWADKERDEDGSALPDKGPTFLGSGTPRSSDGDPAPTAGRESARGDQILFPRPES